MKTKGVKTKNVVLEELEKNRGKFISGEELATSLGISRAAVWKAIKTLQSKGYDIECRQNRGYSLSEGGGKLSSDRINGYLHDDDIHVTVFDEVGSTNDIIKQLAVSGAPEWTVAVARKQTSGRGRMGRTFESPEDNGIYMSILLRPMIPPIDSVKITTLAAVAVSKAIEAFGLRPEIKWVNDIYMESKKVCGILTESGINSETNKLDYAVLGIGVNISDRALSEELKQIAGGVGIEREHDVKNKLAASMIMRLKGLYQKLGSEMIYNEYKSRSFLIGRDVTFKYNGNTQTAHVVDIAPDYSLVVKTDGGETLTLNSGEVSVVATSAG